MREKSNVRMKRIFENTYIAVNIRSKKILSMMKVTYVHAHDSNALPEIVEHIIKSYSMTAIGKLFADGTYDGKDIYRCLTDNGILSCIKARKNVKVTLKTRHILRNLSVIAQKNDLQRWMDSIVSYEPEDCRNDILFNKKNVW
jgi:hypothetical protein